MQRFELCCPTNSKPSSCYRFRTITATFTSLCWTSYRRWLLCMDFSCFKKCSRFAAVFAFQLVSCHCVSTASESLVLACSQRSSRTTWVASFSVCKPCSSWPSFRTWSSTRSSRAETLLAPICCLRKLEEKVCVRTFTQCTVDVISLKRFAWLIYIFRRNLPRVRRLPHAAARVDRTRLLPSQGRGQVQRHAAQCAARARSVDRDGRQVDDDARQDGRQRQLDRRPQRHWDGQGGRRLMKTSCSTSQVKTDILTNIPSTYLIVT